jgi:type IV pilus assembly protein PilX
MNHCSSAAYAGWTRENQQGASLIVTLLMLIAVLMLGISSAQIALQGEKAARNDRDRQIAFQAAEAALMDAELDIENASRPNSRSDLFARHSIAGFVDGCGRGLSNRHLGLCTRAPEGVTPSWQKVDFLDDSANAPSVPYGHFTGQYFQTGEGTLPGKRPRYVIEVLPFNMEGEGATGEDLSYFYRVTAIGFGMRDSTQVVLQTFYRKGGN